MPETESTKQELIFGVNSDTHVNDDLAWYQQNLDVVFPLLIIAIGLFQFILRKWILPVSEDIILKLENQFPSQGLLYRPGPGVFLIIVGLILLLVFNIQD